MKRQSKPTISPVEFIDRVIKLDVKREPFAQFKNRSSWQEKKTFLFWADLWF
jgi:hypothetical protein